MRAICCAILALVCLYYSAHLNPIESGIEYGISLILGIVFIFAAIVLMIIGL